MIFGPLFGRLDTVWMSPDIGAIEAGIPDPDQPVRLRKKPVGHITFGPSAQTGIDCIPVSEPW